jgi:peroxiredoxin
MGCVLTPGQTADRVEWSLAPRLSRAQEFVYSGSFAEQSTGGSVQFNRAYRVENRVLVLEAGAKGAEVALLTVLKAREPAGSKAIVKADAVPTSVRLEVVKLDAQGRATAGPKVSLAAPLEGPPTLECGAFVESPHRRVGLDHTWESGEDGRPLRSWKVTGTEVVDGIRCVKLLGTQQSEDWDKPRADRTAWLRRDHVWLDPVLGVAHRLERVVEQRDPARQEASHKSVLRYDLESSLQYPRQLFEDRRNEVLQARAFADAFMPIMTDPAKHEAQIDALLAKIKYHLDHVPPTPYREAVLHIKRRTEAAKRGETPPQITADSGTPSTVAMPGQQAPDFLVTEFGRKEPARLKKWIGRPIVLVFYSPASQAVRDLLRFAQHLNDDHGPEIMVAGMALSDDADQVRRQRELFQLSFPLLNGTALRQSYVVDSTPKIVVIDDKGIVRAAITGWGRETADEVTEEVKQLLPKAK